MWKIGIAVVITVYVMIALATIFAIRFTKGMLRKENLSIPIKRTIHVVALVLGIYLIPIIGLAMCLIYCEQAIGLIILAILLSVFPVTKYVIIPLSDIKHIKITEKEFGKDSYRARYLREQHKKNFTGGRMNEKNHAE